MNCYILHTFLLAAIKLFITAIICCHYAKYKSKQKKYWFINNTNMEKNNELKKVGIKNRRCYYFNDIRKTKILILRQKII